MKFFVCLFVCLSTSLVSGCALFLTDKDAGTLGCSDPVYVQTTHGNPLAPKHICGAIEEIMDSLRESDIAFSGDLNGGLSIQFFQEHFDEQGDATSAVEQVIHSVVGHLNGVDQYFYHLIVEAYVGGDSSDDQISQAFNRSISLLYLIKQNSLDVLAPDFMGISSFEPIASSDDAKNNRVQVTIRPLL